MSLADLGTFLQTKSGLRYSNQKDTNASVRKRLVLIPVRIKTEMEIHTRLTANQRLGNVLRKTSVKRSWSDQELSITNLG